VALIGDRPRADHVGVGRGGVGLRIKLGKRQALARGGPLVARAGFAVDLVTAKPFIDVADKARLAVFAVVDHVDAEIRLPTHDVGDTAAQLRSRCGRIEGLGPVTLDEGEEIRRPRQAAGVGGENSFAAPLRALVYSICMWNSWT
jgi:hypothetical protein